MTYVALAIFSGSKCVLGLGWDSVLKFPWQSTSLTHEDGQKRGGRCESCGSWGWEAGRVGARVGGRGEVRGGGRGWEVRGGVHTRQEQRGQHDSLRQVCLHMASPCKVT